MIYNVRLGAFKASDTGDQPGLEKDVSGNFCGFIIRPSESFLSSEHEHVKSPEKSLVGVVTDIVKANNKI